MGQRQGYCAKCGRTGLTSDDFYKSEYGYTHDTCKRCNGERNKGRYWKRAATIPDFYEQEAARLRGYRQHKRRDPKYLEKERLRAAANRERRKHEQQAT